jgi:hypothetical protein
MNKKVIAISILAAGLLIALTACGSAASGGIQTDPSAAALPAQAELIIGIFKLEGTAQAVTPQQAAGLLPLWQVYKDLSSSDTAAQQEIQALLSQIHDTMTPEQLQAIADMKLTQQDIFATMQAQGITPGGSQQRSAGSQGDSGSFTPPQGGIPGAFPDGAGPGAGQSLNPEQIATAQAARAQAGGTSRVPSVLIEALIRLLQSRAQ